MLFLLGLFTLGYFENQESFNSYLNKYNKHYNESEYLAEDIIFMIRI